MMSWLDRTVLGAGVTSFLADACHESATAILPAFLLLVGLPPDAAARALGIIEGVADLLSNAVKLAIGWYSDRIGKRKPFVVAGYVLTGSAFSLCALAAGWPLILVAKSIAWVGKGIRGPLRNAILADAVDEAHRGKAFGFHRAGDTLGAILGPLLAFALIRYWLPDSWFASPDEPYRLTFILTLIPGLAAALAFALLIREQRFTPKPGLRFGASMRMLPRRFRRYLIGVGIFGIGDFSHALLILAATLLLAPEHGGKGAAGIAMALYAWKNGCGAVAAFPAGWLGDRFGRRRVLVVGYLLGALTMAGFAVLFVTSAASVISLAILFAGGGVYLAVEETLEPALAADFAPDPSIRGTAFGVLASVNGLGDFVASLGVGFLFAWGGPIALGAAAAFMLIGAIAMAWTVNEMDSTR